MGSACTHEAGTARTGFKKAAASFLNTNRSHVLAANKVVTYLDETCEKRRRSAVKHQVEDRRSHRQLVAQAMSEGS